MIVPIWTAMVDGIRDGFAARDMPLAQCEKAGGRITLETLQRLGAYTPAVLVCVLRIRDLDRARGGKDGMAYTLDLAAYCVSSGQADETEDERAARMAEIMIATDRGILARAGRWDRTDCGVINPDTVSATNLWTGHIDDQGLAMWAVSWEQTINTNPRVRV